MSRQVNSSTLTSNYIIIVMLRPRLFLFTMFFTFTLLVAGYIYAFFYQLGSPVKAEWWVKHFYYYKDHIASTIKERKVIILAGSNALFGIDSNKLEEITGIKTINLAVHAGFDLDFFYYKIKQHMKEGDVIVLPLELPFYWRNSKTDWFINNMMAWEKDGYLASLSIFEMVSFIYAVPPKRILEGVFKQGSTNPLLTSKEVILQIKKGNPQDVKDDQIYDYRLLNNKGDLLLDLNPTRELLITQHEGKNIFIHDYSYSLEYFLKGYNKIKDLVDRRKGQLIMTWPTLIMRNKMFSLVLREHQQRMTEFRQWVSKSGVDIQCNPALFNLDVGYYLDTENHLNRYGADIRSDNLGHCLKRILLGEYKELSYEEANEILRSQEAKFNELKQLSYIRFNRISHLKSIIRALNAYYSETGSYPLTEGWNGLYTSWGASGENWIPGLVPLYLNKLPRDPRMNTDPATQYLYRSNGADYKLISHSPADYDQVSSIYPGLIDQNPQRQAYGFWTENARDW